jgi:hypothetical protein
LLSSVIVAIMLTPISECQASPHFSLSGGLVCRAVRKIVCPVREKNRALGLEQAEARLATVKWPGAATTPQTRWDETRICAPSTHHQVESTSYRLVVLIFSQLLPSAHETRGRG